ncbi:F0F1 ATP synthase subunit A [Candidatus Peregrinibacteria bacterium]|nr:F0F1 ATP synthase subunit A [Candidatus Peregrinibacteria bacterium]
MEIFLNAEKVGQIGSFVITNTLVASTCVVLFLVIVAIKIFRSGYDIKNRFYNFAEMLIEGFMSIIEGVVGRGIVAKQIFGVIVTFFLFVIFNNWFGIFPGMGSVGIKEVEEGKEVFVPLLRSANSDLNMTLAIALVSVCFIQIIAIKNIGIKSYLHKFFNFTNPILCFVGLLEIISELVKIFSFSFRLFGNIFAGDVLLIVMFSLVPWIAPIPFMGIEMFAGFIQALIFSMLTLVFIKVSVSHEEY